MSERKRPDYRTTDKPGDLRYYLLNEYPRGYAYSKAGAHSGFKMHDSRRDEVGNFQTLRGGRPDLTAAFVESLESIPHAAFKEAIAMLRDSTSTRPAGYKLVRALEYYQNERSHRDRGWMPGDEAGRLGGSDQDLRRWRDMAVRHVKEIADWLWKTKYRD